MKLFTVELTVEIVVVANDERDAADAAKNALHGRDIDDDCYETRATPMRYYPGTWDAKSIPFGEGDKADPDRNIAKWIELGAAPEYKVKP